MLLRARSAGRDTSCLSSLCLALAQLRREEGREGVEAGRVVLGEGGRLGGGGEEELRETQTCRMVCYQRGLPRLVLFMPVVASTDVAVWPIAGPLQRCSRDECSSQAQGPGETWF